ncbi:PREDICTED: uncharacterized protein LOC106103298 isoform X3 [Papilio polytes]|uniref:uncharacterized protein LOC106103298 isoform X3 n=1 Tax=Papilio polytes TaxID=76194 RepID=UPI000675D1D8|nr:PREDICTED: uncharacterized protein LOC106103298 isoform X3 [Papilio polytes]
MEDLNKSSWFSTSFRCMDFGDIVSIMTTIIQDDGPMPMRDRKPTERIKNAADKFKESHQPDYEDRFMKNADGIERVHNHNTAYPKLRDELDRRRSLTKNRVMQNGRYCILCDTDITKNGLIGRHDSWWQCPICQISVMALIICLILALGVKN